MRPDNDILRPDNNILRPDNDILRPDINIFRPDINVLRPDIDIFRPDIDILRPDINILLSSSRSWVWLNNNRDWGLLQEVPRWLNLDLEQASSQDNLEARMVLAGLMPATCRYVQLEMP